MVEQHRLGPVQHLFRFRADTALAVSPQVDQHAAQAFQGERGDEAAAVPAVVEDHRLLVELAIELANELLQPKLLHVRHVDIADLAAGKLVYHRLVAGDPIGLAQG